MAAAICGFGNSRKCTVDASTPLRSSQANGDGVDVTQRDHPERFSDQVFRRADRRGLRNDQRIGRRAADVLRTRGNERKPDALLVREDQRNDVRRPDISGTADDRGRRSFAATDDLDVDIDAGRATQG
jgi:hypothetical protein